MWFTGNELTDYDGVFSLSKVILDILKENGYDVKEMEDILAK